MNHETDTMELEIFRAGDYGPKGNWSEESIARIADSYDATVHEAPVTLDHAQQGPADGWVKTVHRAGNRLVATLHRISPRLRELLGSGAYRKRSVELYRELPATGGPYLKALSFLGAAAPEVKGLADPLFREGNAQPPDVVAFDESSPRDAARDLRQSLIARGQWNPAWDNAGLVDVFASITDTGVLSKLVEALSLGPPSVAFGREPRATAHADHVAFHGNPSPQSIALHERAARAVRESPGIDYREALLAASRQSR